MPGDDRDAGNVSGRCRVGDARDHRKSTFPWAPLARRGGVGAGRPVPTDVPSLDGGGRGLPLGSMAERSLPSRNLPGMLSGRGRIVLLPWVVRNTIVFGRPIATTTHGGFTLLLANNPSFYEYLRSSPSDLPWNGDEVNRWWGDTPQGTAQSELGADQLAYRRAWGFIGQEPGMFALSCCARVGRLWSLVPYRIPPHEGVTAEERPTSRLLRYGIGCWYLLELGLAVLGLVVVFPRTHHSNCVPGILLAACFTAVHALYWTDMRMRAPLMPVVAFAPRSDWFGCSVGLESRV